MVLWFLVVVIAAMLNSQPVASQCTLLRCNVDEETDVVKTMLRIQDSMDRQEQQMSSLKEELWFQ